MDAAERPRSPRKGGGWWWWACSPGGWTPQQSQCLPACLASNIRPQTRCQTASPPCRSPAHGTSNVRTSHFSALFPSIHPPVSVSLQQACSFPSFFGLEPSYYEMTGARPSPTNLDHTTGSGCDDVDNGCPAAIQPASRNTEGKTPPLPSCAAGLTEARDVTVRRGTLLSTTR